MELNVGKTKILCNAFVGEGNVHCITKCGSIEIVAANEKHEHLGRMLRGEVSNRGTIAVNHRIQCGWMKYHGLQHNFEDKHVPIRLRFKLFDAVIRPLLYTRWKHVH